MRRVELAAGNGGILAGCLIGFAAADAAYGSPDDDAPDDAAPDDDAPDDDAPDDDAPGADADDAGEPEAPRLLGDIVVCPTRAAAQARAAGTPLSFEVAMLLVHGTLHVLGYDHETDAGEMALRQAGYLDDASWERLLGKV